MNKNIAIGLGVIVLIVIAILLWGGARNAQEGDQVNNGGEGNSESLAVYFQEQMFDRGIEAGRIPIEGFDAGLLMSAYPALEKSDFDGVATFEGVYRLEGSELVFERTGGQMVSSAERTVSREGYVTLLENLSERLDVETNDQADIDALITQINTADVIETRIGQSGAALGVRITPIEVVEDSRCPEDVTCIQAGTVRVKATLVSGLGTAEQIFKLGESVTTEAEIVTLTQVGPLPQSGVTLEGSDYTFWFRVEKK